MRNLIYLILTFGCLTFHYATSRSDNKFCDKYDKDGSCESNEDDDGPCWIEEKQKPKEKQNESGKLVRLNPYEVGYVLL